MQQISEQRALLPEFLNVTIVVHARLWDEITLSA